MPCTRKFKHHLRSTSKHARTHAPTHPPTHTCNTNTDKPHTHTHTQACAVCSRVRIVQRCTLHAQYASTHTYTHSGTKTPSSIHTHTYNHTHKHEQPCMHSAHRTMQAHTRTHMPCTRTHAGSGGHHPCYHAQACTCSLSAQ
jgi:hypothetical protein